MGIVSSFNTCCCTNFCFPATFIPVQSVSQLPLPAFSSLFSFLAMDIFAGCRGWFRKFVGFTSRKVTSTPRKFSCMICTCGMFYLPYTGTPTPFPGTHVQVAYEFFGELQLISHVLFPWERISASYFWHPFAWHLPAVRKPSQQHGHPRRHHYHKHHQYPEPPPASKNFFISCTCSSFGGLNFFLLLHEEDQSNHIEAMRQISPPSAAAIPKKQPSIIHQQVSEHRVKIVIGNHAFNQLQVMKTLPNCNEWTRQVSQKLPINHESFKHTLTPSKGPMAPPQIFWMPLRISSDMVPGWWWLSLSWPFWGRERSPFWSSAKQWCTAKSLRLSFMCCTWEWNPR